MAVAFKVDGYDQWVEVLDDGTVRYHCPEWERPLLPLDIYHPQFDPPADWEAINESQAIDELIEATKDTDA